MLVLIFMSMCFPKLNFPFGRIGASSSLSPVNKFSETLQSLHALVLVIVLNRIYFITYVIVHSFTMLYIVNNLTIL